MATQNKLIWIIIIAVTITAVINFLSEILSNSTGFAITPIISTINMALAGFVAGIGFYLAKSFAEK
ncbi:MAG: hypothetical protein KAT28_04755 [Candidatus Aenigmarchaeota archaeon]|nr:hypothetical protein [Candidatus Aenigmarchaeota archaeon]